MDVINMKDLKLELGNASFYLRLMELVQDEELSEILEKKAISEMKRFVEEKDLDEDLKEMLINLPSSFGSIDVVIPDAIMILNKSPTTNGTTPINNSSGSVNTRPELSIVLYKPINPGT